MTGLAYRPKRLDNATARHKEAAKASVLTPVACKPVPSKTAATKKAPARKTATPIMAQANFEDLAYRPKRPKSGTTAQKETTNTSAPKIVGIERTPRVLGIGAPKSTVTNGRNTKTSTPTTSVQTGTTRWVAVPLKRPVHPKRLPLTRKLKAENPLNPRWFRMYELLHEGEEARQMRLRRNTSPYAGIIRDLEELMKMPMKGFWPKYLFGHLYRDILLYIKKTIKASDLSSELSSPVIEAAVQTRVAKSLNKGLNSSQIVRTIQFVDVYRTYHFFTTFRNKFGRPINKTSAEWGDGHAYNGELNGAIGMISKGVTIIDLTDPMAKVNIKALSDLAIFDLTDAMAKVNMKPRYDYVRRSAYDLAMDLPPKSGAFTPL